MSNDDLPDGFFVPNRQERLAQWKRDYQLYQPGAPVGVGSQPHVDGSVVTDMLAPIYADVKSVARDSNLDDKTLEGLKEEARSLGLPEQLPASGAVGFVASNVSAGGVFVDINRELVDERTNLRFRCLVSATYVDTQPIPIVGIDTGPETNLPSGTVLSWSTPPPGLGKAATVIADDDGNGLIDGRAEETADDIRRRIKTEQQDPSAAANAAHVSRLVKDAGRALGIAIEECFVFPAIKGPGTMAFCFTLRPAKPGGSRAPSPIQIAQVLAFITGPVPEDDGAIACSILEVGVTTVLAVDWGPGAVGWADASPWPLAPDAFQVSAVTSAVLFNVSSVAGSPVAPQIGQTFAFYDARNGLFVEKRVGAVSSLGGGAWQITCDTTNNASDTGYTPSVAQRLCPWSDSLNDLVVPMQLEFGKLGPGEMLASPFDAGLRGKRLPTSTPTVFPNGLRHKMVDVVAELPSVADAIWTSPSVPFAAPVGSPAVSVNLLTLGTLLVFPLTLA